MSVPPGEGMQNGLGFDALLKVPDPTIELIDPQAAPTDMLDRVHVNTPGRCLETDTPLGKISVEMYWREGDDPHADEIRGDFFPALDTALDPDAEANPTATRHHPYTILPDGALYEVVVRVPFDAVDAEWSPERTTTIGGTKSLLGGVSLSEFRRAYPGVEVDLPEGFYTITASERTKPVVAIVARVENGEPLARVQTVSDAAVRYHETLSADFRRSAPQADTAVAIINSRTTIHDNGKADLQRLVFKTHDGFQRTGEGAEENSGVIELIALQGEAVEFAGFTFSPYRPPIIAPPRRNDYGYGTLSYGQTKSGGLTGGQTCYRPPETVKVSMTGVRNLRAIAAFRFAMAGAQEAPTVEA